MGYRWVAGDRDAPEIDGLVIVEENSVPMGELLPVRITGAMAYDLSGVLPHPPTKMG